MADTEVPTHSTPGDVADYVFRDRNFSEINKVKLGHMGGPLPRARLQGV